MINDHIFSYLDYYVDLPHPPHYAVMLTGPWGIGKSFNIKRYLRSLNERGKKTAYVSLYGVKSTDDIAAAVLATLAIKKDGKLGQLGEQLGRALWTKMASGTGQSALTLLPDSFCDLLVLDDLERAMMSPVEVLGFINSFIEHENRKVVIVGNEAKLKDQEAYRSEREKVVAMTFELSEETDAALAHFIASIEPQKTREFLQSAVGDIRQVFNQSETRNLRLLDQSLHAWARFYTIVNQELKKRHEGIISAFRLFLALSLEVRAGRLEQQDLSDRVNKVVSGQMQQRQDNGAGGTPLSKAQDRYGRIFLHDSILTDEALIGVLCHGRVDATSINESLAVHPLFVALEEEPSWRKVWHGFQREADEFEQAFKEMEREFQDRKFDDPGVILHVFGLRLWGADMGEIHKSESEIVAEGKAYVNELRRNRRLKRFRQNGFHGGSHGLGFQFREKAAFKELQKYLFDQAELAYQETWPKLSESLLNDVAGDADKFYSRICWSGGAVNPDCAEEPILCKVPPEKFVDHLIACAPTAQRTVLSALGRRYETERNELKPEGEWLIAFHRELSSRILALPRIRQYSLSNDANYFLGDALIRAQAAVKHQSSL